MHGPATNHEAEQMPIHSDSAGTVRAAAQFRSILSAGRDAAQEVQDVPRHFRDLNLDRIVNALTAGKEEYDLKPFFYAPLKRIDEITYRHEVMQDLEGPRIFEIVGSFAREFRLMRQRLASAAKSHYAEQQQGLFLESVELYCRAVQQCASSFAAAEPRSEGLRRFSNFLDEHCASAAFVALLDRTTRLRIGLDAIRYSILIGDGGFTVRPYKDEPDYSAEVDNTFRRFKQGSVQDYRVRYSDTRDMDHIEAKALEFVGRLNPDLFSDLEDFCLANSSFQNETIVRFDREIEFYVAYLDYLAKFKQTGLPFCYPRLSGTDKHVRNTECFDLALADKLVGKSEIVRNGFELNGPERIFVVSGPNQGGKTTFARTFGQLHYLASLGCCVPGRDARLFLFDEILTHFEKEENIRDLRGKLQDDLVRIHEILSKATSNSILIMNEIFTSTTVEDATDLSRRIMKKIVDLDALCVWVTFIDEMSTFSPLTVSMVSTIVPEDPAQRTYKIERRHADGLSYALSIAEKYGLTYDRLKERVPS